MQTQDAATPTRPEPLAGEPPGVARASGAPDPVALGQLWADQFQHLTTLGVAGAGGVLVLLQAQVLGLEQRWWLALGLFVLTAVLSVYGQMEVVDRATTGAMPGERPRRLRAWALACLGAAGGAAIATLGF